MERVPSLEEARFFVDEDLSGLGIALLRLRRDVLVGRRPPVNDVVPKDDPDWIPIVAAHRWNGTPLLTLRDRLTSEESFGVAFGDDVLLGGGDLTAMHGMASTGADGVVAA